MSAEGSKKKPEGGVPVISVKEAERLKRIMTHQLGAVIKNHPDLSDEYADLGGRLQSALETDNQGLISSIAAKAKAFLDKNLPDIEATYEEESRRQAEIAEAQAEAVRQARLAAEAAQKGGPAIEDKADLSDAPPEVLQAVGALSNNGALDIDLGELAPSQAVDVHASEERPGKKELKVPRGTARAEKRNGERYEAQLQGRNIADLEGEGGIVLEKPAQAVPQEKTFHDAPFPTEKESSPKTLKDIFGDEMPAYERDMFNKLPRDKKASYLRHLQAEQARTEEGRSAEEARESALKKGKKARPKEVDSGQSRSQSAPSRRMQSDMKRLQSEKAPAETAAEKAFDARAVETMEGEGGRVIGDPRRYSREAKASYLKLADIAKEAGVNPGELKEDVWAVPNVILDAIQELADLRSIVTDGEQQENLNKRIMRLTQRLSSQEMRAVIERAAKEAKEKKDAAAAETAATQAKGAESAAAPAPESEAAREIPEFSRHKPAPEPTLGDDYDALTHNDYLSQPKEGTPSEWRKLLAESIKILTSRTAPPERQEPTLDIRRVTPLGEEVMPGPGTPAAPPPPEAPPPPAPPPPPPESPGKGPPELPPEPAPRPEPEAGRGREGLPLGYHLSERNRGFFSRMSDKAKGIARHVYEQHLPTLISSGIGKMGIAYNDFWVRRNETKTVNLKGKMDDLDFQLRTIEELKEDATAAMKEMRREGLPGRDHYLLTLRDLERQRTGLLNRKDKLQSKVEARMNTADEFANRRDAIAHKFIKKYEEQLKPFERVLAETVAERDQWEMRCAIVEARHKQELERIAQLEERQHAAEKNLERAGASGREIKKTVGLLAKQIQSYKDKVEKERRWMRHELDDANALVARYDKYAAPYRDRRAEFARITQRRPIDLELPERALEVPFEAYELARAHPRAEAREEARPAGAPAPEGGPERNESGVERFRLGDLVSAWNDYIKREFSSDIWRATFVDGKQLSEMSRARLDFPLDLDGFLMLLRPYYRSKKMNVEKFLKSYNRFKSATLRRSRL